MCKNSSGYPITVPSGYVNSVGTTNTYINNGVQKIRVSATDLNGANLTWPNPGIPLELTGG